MLRAAVLVLVALALFPAVGRGDPSPPIAQMMDTPASAFDLFLLDLQEQMKSDAPPGLQLTGLYYEFTDNLLFVTFGLRQDSFTWNRFWASKTGREAVLRENLDILTKRVGVEPLTQGGRGKLFGWIQFVPIRHGWANKAIDEPSVRKELSERTVVELSADDFTGREDARYLISRDQHGKVTFEKKTLEDAIKDWEGRTK